MNTSLKAKIETAIDSVITENCEEDYWEEYIHPELIRQMVDAAESVFDAAQSAQKFQNEQ